MKLYEITAYYRNALAIFDEQDDPENEIPPDAIPDMLAALEGEFSDKAIQVAAFMRKLEATAAAIKVEEDKMSKRRQALEKKVSTFRDYIKMNMESTGITKIPSPWFVLSVQKSQASVEIDDEGALPDEFVVIKKQPNKLAIKEILKAGLEVPGARLVNGTHLVLR